MTITRGHRCPRYICSGGPGYRGVRVSDAGLGKASWLRCWRITPARPGTTKLASRVIDLFADPAGLQVARRWARSRALDFTWD